MKVPRLFGLLLFISQVSLMTTVLAKSSNQQCATNKLNTVQISDGFNEMPGWFPYSYRDQVKGFTGTDIELLRSILVKIGYQFEHSNDLPETRKTFTDPSCFFNALIGATYTKERSTTFYFSLPYRKEEIGLFYAKPELRKIKTLREVFFHQHSVAYNKVGFYGETFQAIVKEFNNPHLIHIESPHRRLKLLSKGRVDYIVGDITHITKTNALLKYGKIYQLPKILNSTDVHFAFSKKAFDDRLFKNLIKS
jgi:hypothetical protein